MTREEVYDRCKEKYGYFVPNYRYIYGCGKARVEDNFFYSVRLLLPTEAIDAIIDCAVEEAIRAVKEVNRNDT